MNPLVPYSLNLIILLLTLILFYKFSLKKIPPFILLVTLSLILAPLFHYRHPQPIFNLLPFLTWLFLAVITLKKQVKPLISALALGVILLSNLYGLRIITLPFHFQPGNTILANWHIAESISQHQQDALYVLYSLRPILFNQLGYLYFTLTNTVYYLSLSNLYNIFLILNLYPLLIGIFELFRSHRDKEKLFIFGSLMITLLVMGFSRPVQEITSLFVISPLLIYLILLGLKKINLKLYLMLALLSLFIQTCSYL